MKQILDIQYLTKTFGGLVAVESMSLNVREQEIVALIGPNGAGKTTFFNCITGIYTPNSGEMVIHHQNKSTSLKNKKPNQITTSGIARTFQNIRLFSNMTVLENVMVGRHSKTRYGILSSLIRGKKFQQEEKKSISESYQVLEEMGLEKYAHQFANNLPYADQRKLEIARALATKPTVLLLDEPAAGMNPQETKELEALIDQIRTQKKVSILLIEHDMKLVMSISDRIFVMEYGRKIAEGIPTEIQKNPNVIKAYLGEEIDADY